jgi:hypothetical protein
MTTMTATQMPHPGAGGAVTAGTVNDAIRALARGQRDGDAPHGAPAPASLAFGPGIPVPATRIRRWCGPRVFP